MRFCPFCSAENASEAAQCTSCGRRLPPLPPRRQKTQASPAASPQTLGQAGDAASLGTAKPAPSTAEAPPRRSVLAALVPSPSSLRREAAPSEIRPAGSEARRRGDVTFQPGPASDLHDADTSGETVVQASPAHAEEETATEIRDPSRYAPRRSDSFGDNDTVLDGGPLSPSLAIPLPAPPTSSTSIPVGPIPIPGSSPVPVPVPISGSTSAPASESSSPASSPHLLPTPKSAPREPTFPDPPPTRIGRPDALLDRPFTPPQVIPIPEIPEPGVINSARYSITFLRARWQRRTAIRVLHEEIKQDTTALDQVLGTLGRTVRAAKVDSRVLAGENQAIDDAEVRRARLEQAQAEVLSRKSDEIAKFHEIEQERLGKIGVAERNLDEAQRELVNLEVQRRGLRDKRKEVERRQRAYLKAAEDRDAESGSETLGDTRAALRRQAEEHRREAAELEPERQDIDRRLGALERPLAQAQSRVDSSRAELDSARRSLNDAREGHRHRLSELDAEQARKGAELAHAEAEIQRRMVTLGTLINLNRIERPDFAELYERIDRLRGAIGARTTEIEKLTAEREAFDKASLTRGLVVMGAGAVLALTFVVILLALV